MLARWNGHEEDYLVHYWDEEKASVDIWLWGWELERAEA